MASWYFVKNGERNGPMGRAELDARIAEGAIQADTLVWSVGMSAWQRAGALPELGLLSPGMPPPLPPPLHPEGTMDPARDADETRRRALELVEKELAAVHETNGPEYAGFWMRCAAKMVDGLVLYGPALLVERAVVGLYFNGVTPDILTDWMGWLRMVSLAAPVNLVIAIAYSVYFITRFEATPGKRLLGLRVVRSDGGRVGAARVMGRYFAEQLSAIVFLAGYVMSAFDEEKRTLHDYLCDTRVVKGAREEAARPRPASLTTEG